MLFIVLTLDIIAGLRSLQEKVDNLSTENKVQKSLVQKLENELYHQRKSYDEVENRMHRVSSRDSGFGSVGDSDEALEQQKAIHAKERMSYPLEIISNGRTAKSIICIEIKDWILGKSTYVGEGSSAKTPGGSRRSRKGDIESNK